MRNNLAWPLGALLTAMAVAGCSGEIDDLPTATPTDAPTNLDQTDPPTSTPEATLPAGVTPTEIPDTAGEGTPTRPPDTPSTQTPVGPTPTPTMGTPTAEPTPPKNNAPTATLSAPESGATYLSGQAILFAGTVSDFESSAAELTVSLSSDLSGSLGQPNVTGDGQVSLTVFDLSVGEHTITLEASDPGGLSGTDTVTITVEASTGVPLLSITSPTEARYQIGDDLTFTAEVSDGEDAATDLTVTWTSDLSGEFQSMSPDSAGVATFNTNALGRGNHTITVEVADTDGNTTAGGLSLTVNDAPAPPAIQFDPAAPGTGDDIKAEVFSIDLEEDEITFSYSWTVDGADAGITENTVPSDLTTRGQVWVVTVIASDPDVSSEPNTAEVIIDNTPPTAQAALLTPEDATAADTLTCTGQGFSDPDEGDEEGYTYSWQISGEDVFGVDTSTLSGRFERGDTVTCFVAPNDGLANGPRVESNTVTIQNAAPVVDPVSLDPNTDVTEATILTCTGGEARDPDDDDFDASYSWTVSDAIVDGATGVTLSGESFSKGDTVSCTVTATDEGGATTSVSSEQITVVNAIPVVTSIVVTPENPTAEDPLVCQVEAEDADPDDLVALSYSWAIDDVPVEDATEATLAAGSAERGQAIVCYATPSDGVATGETAASAPVTLDNTAPSIDDVEITPATATTSDTLTCLPLGFSDDEGDDPIYAYEWTISGEVSAITEATLPNGETTKGDVITCTVTPSDGFANGEAVTSAPLTINNTAPVITEVVITPEAPTVDSTLTCNVTAEDLDDEELTLSYTWAVSGATVDGETEMTLPSTAFGGGDTVTCTATAHDGDDSSEAVTSDPVSVGNQAPSDPEVEIIPEAPLPGQALTVNVTTASVDPDDDVVFYLYEWYVDGNLTDYTGSSLPAFKTLEGETWTASVVGTDGSAVSGAATAEVFVTEPDADGDGYGAFVDCDDDNADVHPGAAEPINGRDDDCDGNLDNRWPVDHPFGRSDTGEVSSIAVAAPGIAHIAYLDRTLDTVRYGRIEGESALFVDTPDPSLDAVGASELPLSIAVDTLDVPHVAMFDTQTQDLVYATRVGSQWMTQTIDSDGEVGHKPEIAVDEFGIAHIVYLDQTNDALKYARGFLGSFAVVTVAEGLQSGNHHHVAVDADGAAHIAWQQTISGTLRYGRYVDGQGTPDDVVTAGDVGNYVRIAIAPLTGDVHMAYVNNTTGNVDHVVGVAGAWERTTSVSGLSVLGRIALAVNPVTGAPHILAYDAATQDLTHSHLEGAEWDASVGVGFQEAIGYNPSAAIDAEQTLHASFFLADSEDIYYATAAAETGWAFNLYSVEGIDQTGAYNDVAVGSDGYPALYTFGLDTSSSTEFGIYLGQKGDGFMVRAPNANATSHIYGQLEIAPDGTTHMMEWDPDTAVLSHLESADGLSWTVNELTDSLFTTNGINLAVASDGGVYGAYTDYWGSRPLACSFTNPNYTEVNLVFRLPGEEDFTRESVVYTCTNSSTLPLATPTVAVADDGTVHLAFYRQAGGDLIYMVRDTDGNWGEPIVVDDTDDTGFKPFIAINPTDGFPAIAHINRTTGKLRLSTRGPVAWLTVNVADAYTQGPVVMRYDDEGSVHLLFRDETGRRVHYATNRDGGFDTELVAIRPAAADLGTSAGMVLDADGNPHVSFYDSEAGSVAYVRGKLFDHSF